MVPDLATWHIRVGGVLLFGASERPLNDPGVDLDEPMVPMPRMEHIGTVRFCHFT